MFKLLPPLFLVAPVAWLTWAVLTGFEALSPTFNWLGLTPATSWTILAVQAVIAAIFLTPLWRLVWRWTPLGRWFYPDLNGEWDVEVRTNWPRIDATLRAANGETGPVDVRLADEDTLPPLQSMTLRATIVQSWARMRIDVRNPSGDSPIKASKTVAVEPFRGEEGRHGLIYVFEQESANTSVADDRIFYGAARIVVDQSGPDILCGSMWTDRMWRRGMNTAAEVRFVRRGSQGAAT